MEEEVKSLRKERDQLDQERASALETERKVGKELKTRSRELAGKSCFVFFDHAVLFSFYIVVACC